MRLWFRRKRQKPEPEVTPVPIKPPAKKRAPANKRRVPEQKEA